MFSVTIMHYAHLISHIVTMYNWLLLMPHHSLLPCRFSCQNVQNLRVLIINSAKCFWTWDKKNYSYLSKTLRTEPITTVYIRFLRNCSRHSQWRKFVGTLLFQFCLRVTPEEGEWDTWAIIQNIAAFKTFLFNTVIDSTVDCLLKNKTPSESGIF